MQIPTDPVGAVIFGINLVLEGIDLISAYDRVANGISAQAQAENRDVTEQESALIKALRDESAKARRGE